MATIFERIQQIESKVLSSGNDESQDQLQAFVLALVARSLSGTTDIWNFGKFDHSPHGAFKRIHRLYINGRVGDRLLQALRGLDEMISGGADHWQLLQLECGEPAALAMAAVLELEQFRDWLFTGFPSVEPVLAKAEALLAK